MDLIKNIILTSRPKQQIKNILVIIPFILSVNLWYSLPSNLIINLLTNVLIGLVSFILGSWFIYIVNDYIDRNADKNHPKKSNKPIASNKIPQKLIMLVSALILISSVSFGLITSSRFLLILCIYISLMTLYSLIIKKVFLVDIISIAIGYMLRVYGGALIVVNSIDETINVSIWLILCTGFASLFVLSIKRFSEITNDKLTSRSSLSGNKSKLLYNSINLNELLTYISYSFYCISINFSSIFSANTPSDLSLLLTLPLVILGMRRFKKDSLNSSYGDQPEEIIFKSKFIILIFFSWIIISSLIIYVRN
jgi:4-hydroxybenzoate polyprenyltransferase